MTGVYQLEIKETLDELKKQLRVQKTASDKERIQLLYLLKSEQAQTITMAANILGRHRVTVQKWLSRYRAGGIEYFLAHKPPTGRKPSIPKWAQEALKKQLELEPGFESYDEICQWLSNQLGIEANYKTVHKLAHYRLQAAPKVPRPESNKTSEEKVEVFKKKWQKITARGVKPKGKVQWQFQATYLYGIVEPKRARTFF